MTDRELDIAAWLKHPSAFWLHPEGPMSDTTPEEWLAKQTIGPDVGGDFVIYPVRVTFLLPGESVG